MRHPSRGVGHPRSLSRLCAFPLLAHHRPKVEADPSDLWPRLGLGIALFALRRFREALPHLAVAADQLPNDARVQYRYAIALEETVCVVGTSSSRLGYCGVLTLLCCQGDWRRAMDILQKVVQLVPDWPGANRDIGSLCFNRGDVWSAVKYWTAAVRVELFPHLATHGDLTHGA